MDAGELRAAEAAEARLGELELTQSQVGVDPKTWREFVTGEKWPKQARTRARIEATLQWKRGALLRIAHGGNPDDENIHPAATGTGALTAPAGSTTGSAAVESMILRDENERKLWALPLPVEQRRGMIAFYRMQRELNEEDSEQAS